MTDVTIGYGSQFGIGDDNSPQGFDYLAQVVSITPPGISRDAVDATHMQSESGFREFIAGLGDGGEVSITLNFIPGTGDAVTLMSEFNSRDSNEYRIKFPSGATCDFSGFCTGFEPETPLEDRQTATATFKVTGLPVYTAA